MGKIAAISGALGDCCYALPVLHHLGVTDLYIKKIALENGSNTFDALAKFIQSQGIIPHSVETDLPFHEWPPGLKFDYDMDAARKRPGRGIVHIIKHYVDQFAPEMTDWHLPWLKNIDEFWDVEQHSLIALTSRWRDYSTVDWRRVYETIKGKVYFIGFDQDWKEFYNKYGEIEFIKTPSLYDAARLIAGCTALYTNQNPMLTIAQGLGKEYWLEQKPGKTNTLLYTKNEHILK